MMVLVVAGIVGTIVFWGQFLDPLFIKLPIVQGLLPSL